MTTSATDGTGDGDDPGTPSDTPLVPVLQSVLNSVVFGHLVQIANVSGNVSLTLLPRPERGPVVVGDIPEQPLGFQLREELLARLHARAGVEGAAVLTAVTGAPGVGKTLLAASYAWACQHANWQVIVWVSAETGDQIVTGLAALAQHLGLRGQDEDAFSAAGKAKAWLSTCSTAGLPGLLVFDNAVSVKEVAAWRPAIGAVRVLITSRNRAFHQRYAAVEVDIFTTAQAITFLTERTGLDDTDGAQALAAELGYLPLALAQACAYIAHKRLTYAAYLRLLAAFPLGNYLPAGTYDAYPDSTAKAILLSVTAAEDDHPEAAQLLRVLALLSPAGVPRTMLTGGADPDNLSLPIAELAAATAAQERLAALADTSLITFTKDRTTVRVHRLIQRVIRERATIDGDLGAVITQATGLISAYAATVPDDATLLDAGPAIEALIEQTDELYLHANPDHLSADLLRLRNMCGNFLHVVADDRAIPLYGQTLADRRRVLGENNPDTFASCDNLARAYWAARAWHHAIPLFEESLAGRVRELGEDHIDVVTSRARLTKAHKKAGDLTRAISLLEQTLASYTRLVGEDHAATIAARDDLISVCESVGDLGRATPLYEQTLVVRRRVLGEEHPDTLTAGHNFASALTDTNDLVRAIPVFEQTLAARRRVLGENHPDTFNTRHSLAEVLVKADKAVQAIPLCEQTLADSEQVLGEEHPDVLVFRDHLAYALVKAGKADHAIPLCEKTLADSVQILGEDDPETIIFRNNLAEAYEAADDLTRAIPLYEKALADCERVLGERDPQTEMVRAKLQDLRCL